VTDEQIRCQFATCANEFRILAKMLGEDSSIGVAVTEVARWLDEKRERWDE
jgi:hypothetical protein